MEQLPVTLARIVSVWWLIFWRGLAVGLPAAAVFGILAGSFWALMGLPIASLRSAIPAISMVLGVR